MLQAQNYYFFLVYAIIMEHVYAILSRALFYFLVVVIVAVVEYLNADAFYKSYL